MNHKVVFVDWNGTLSDSLFWHRWQGNEDYARTQKALFEDPIGRELLSSWMIGKSSYEGVLQYLENSTSIPYAKLAQGLEESSKQMEFIDESVVELVQALQARGTKVVIATDNMDVFRHWTIPAMKLEELFDGIITSDSRRALKTHTHPDGQTRFFEHFFAQNPEIKPGDTVLIDDSKDTQIVETFGMQFRHVKEGSSLTHHLKEILAAID